VSPAAVPSAGPPGAGGRGRRSQEARGPDIRIDRLALRVTGLDEDAARTLARLVAQELPPGLTGPAAVRLAAGQHLGRVRIQVTADAAEQGQPDLLARRIAGELARTLAHGQGPGAPDAGAAG
jgi:hypothetical protein